MMIYIVLCLLNNYFIIESAVPLQRIVARRCTPKNRGWGFAPDPKS